MVKFAATFIGVILLAFIGYKQFNNGPQDEKSSIAQAINIAKNDAPLKPEEEALLKLQLAIVDFNARNGKPPDQLRDLTPTYFETIPQDPTTGKEFPYVTDGQTYHLGAQVEGQAKLEDTKIMNGSLSSKTDKTGSQLTLLLNDAEFVNPNSIQEDNFIYDPNGKRDPFMPFDNSPPKPTGKSPLEQYDLGEFRFTGVISRPTGEKLAMVEDANGKGYTVSLGSKIGLNGGEVIDIQDGIFKVLETSVDLAGREQQKVIEKKKFAANEEIKKSKVKTSPNSIIKPPIGHK